VLLGVLLSERLTGSLGSPVSRRDLGLSAGPCGFSSSAVHRNLPTAASSSRELSASSRVLRPATCPPYRERPCDLSRPASAFRGVLSLIAASTGGVHHCAGSPDPALKFPPRRFSRPRGFAPPPAFAGLFHPAATSRVCPPGVCPSPRSRTGFPRPIHALLPFKHSDLRFDPRQPLRPRFQGLAPRGECGVGRGGLDPDRSAPLMGFLFLLRVFPPRNAQVPSHPLRPRPLTAMNPPQLALGVSPLRGLACLEPGCRPARGSWPEPPPSFRKSGSRPRDRAVHRDRRTRADGEHALCHVRCAASARIHEARDFRFRQEVNAFLWAACGRMASALCSNCEQAACVADDGSVN
jgi:hypothetical protein